MLYWCWCVDVKTSWRGHSKNVECWCTYLNKRLALMCCAGVILSQRKGYIHIPKKGKSTFFCQIVQTCLFCRGCWAKLSHFSTNFGWRFMWFALFVNFSQKFGLKSLSKCFEKCGKIAKRRKFGAFCDWPQISKVWLIWFPTALAINQII